MKIGIVIYSGDSETVWNALRFANYSVAMGDGVKMFLIGKGVECVKSELLDTEKFEVTEQLQIFLKTGGRIFACGTCLEIHQLKAPESFTVATLKDLHEIIKESDRLVTF